MAEANAPTFTTTLGIKGLSAKTLYTFTVTCTNVASQNGPSVSATAKTKTEGLSDCVPIHACMHAKSHYISLILLDLRTYAHVNCQVYIIKIVYDDLWANSQ